MTEIVVDGKKSIRQALMGERIFVYFEDYSQSLLLQTKHLLFYYRLLPIKLRTHLWRMIMRAVANQKMLFFLHHHHRHDETSETSAFVISQ